MFPIYTKTLLPQENFEVLYEDSIFVEGSRHSARYKLEKATQSERPCDFP